MVTAHVRHEGVNWSQAAVCSTLYELHHESPDCCCIGYIGAASWLCYVRLCYGYIVVVAASMAAASARRETVLRPLSQPGENKLVCSSYGSLNLLPAS